MKTATPIAAELRRSRALTRCADEHGVDAGALELVDLRLRGRAARSAIASLPAGTSESRSSTCCERLVRVARGEDEELRIEALERLLELVLVLDADDELDVVGELDIALARADDAGVLARSRARHRESDDRERAGGADRVDDRRRGRAAPRLRGLGLACRLRPVDGDDQRDAVALGYGLAQTSRAGHARRVYPTTVRYRGSVRVRLAILLLVAGAARRRGGRRAPGARRHERAPTSSPAREGSDRVVARAGNDRIAVEYDGGVDRVSCGAGRDVVAADARDRIEADCEVVSRRIHRDRHTNVDSQHESEVEPDSQTVGQTTVAVFQVGRNRAGGAASIGFSTSKDGGRTWREGILPGLTANTTPPGPSARASDPVVAWDAAHGVWLANTLAIAAGASRLTIHRSVDGLAWSRADRRGVRPSTQNLAYDKNWLTCDNGPTSPFRGRCYLAYTLVGDPRDDLALQRSDDGGRTWSPRSR